jgi:putative transposase
MPRTSQAAVGGYGYHVLNRGNARTTVFDKDEDFQAFLKLSAEASLRHPMRILAFCLMHNHFHPALWPTDDGDLSRWMHWLLTTQVRRYRSTVVFGLRHCSLTHLANQVGGLGLGFIISAHDEL